MELGKADVFLKTYKTTHESKGVCMHRKDLRWFTCHLQPVPGSVQARTDNEAEPYHACQSTENMPLINTQSPSAKAGRLTGSRHLSKISVQPLAKG